MASPGDIASVDGGSPVPGHTVLVSGPAAAQEWTAEAERIIPPAAAHLSHMGLAPASCEISVTLVDLDEIRDLNHRYRGIDAPTDVLSFPQLEAGSTVPITWPADVAFPIGDIVICVPRLIEQAEEYGHSELREFGYLLMHGLLHLLGFDHETDEDKAVMRAREEDLLAAAGLTRTAEAS